VMGMMVVMRGGKSRAGKHHQQQSSSKNLFHGTNLAWSSARRHRNVPCESRQERVPCGAVRAANQRKLKPR
jgi:hypothetical protein